MGGSFQEAGQPREVWEKGCAALAAVWTCEGLAGMLLERWVEANTWGSDELQKAQL